MHDDNSRPRFGGAFFETMDERARRGMLPAPMPTPRPPRRPKLDRCRALELLTSSPQEGCSEAIMRDRRRQVIEPHVLSSPSWGRRNSPPPPPKPRGGLAALAGERSELVRVRCPSPHAPLRSREKSSTAAAGWARLIATQTTPLLLGPGPGQPASKRRDCEARRCRPVQEARDDSW
jgi:hypothetical protein